MSNLPEIMQEDYVHDEEETARLIFSPLHFNKDNKLRANVYRPSADTDRISVNRVSYCEIKHCVTQGQTMANRNKNVYYGHGVIASKSIRDIGDDVDVVASPSGSNKFHADITTGIKAQKGEPLKMELQVILDRLLEKAKIFLAGNNQQIDV